MTPVERYAPAEDANALRRALKVILGFALPQACVHCRREGELICASCYADLTPVDGSRCRSCGEAVGERYSVCTSCALTPPPLDTMAPVFRYRGAARSAILALKFRSLRSIAPLMALPMSEQSLVANGDISCIVPVPAHSRRLRERGYNQSALLAREVAKLADIPCLENGLRKVVHTPSQVDLNRHERSNSVRGAFEAEFDFANAHVLLIDDVATTGSTLMSCASALKHANARRVSALTFAKEYQTSSDTLD